MSVIEGLYYTEQHEWVKVDGEIAVIGITDHAQDLLGEITYVELPEVGQEVGSGGELAVVESSKAASDVYSPVGGEVTEINETLESEPELINSDCYDDGWICKVKMVDSADAEGLMSSADYEEFLKSAE